MFAVLLIENPPQYFAKEMAKADELKILRMMVSRSEVRVLICVEGENILSSNRSLLDDKKANNGLKNGICTSLIYLRKDVPESQRK